MKIILLKIKTSCAGKVIKNTKVFGDKGIEKAKLYKLYKKGRDKIDKDLNIVQIISKLRYIHTAMLRTLNKDDVTMNMLSK